MTHTLHKKITCNNNIIYSSTTKLLKEIFIQKSNLI